jgi:hypothetical protein
MQQRRGSPCSFPADQGIANRDEFALDSPHLLGVRFGLNCWVASTETSSPTTPPTAIEVARAETARHELKTLPEKRAIPRGFGGWGLLNPNRRRWVWSPMGEAARVYLCCQFRRFGLLPRLAAFILFSLSAGSGSDQKISGPAGNE